MPEVMFNGPAGRIEGKYRHSAVKGAPAALILHPHPLYGGTMNNKVVYNIYQAFLANGFSTLRINFRGVGKSEGEFDNGIGELMDAATAMDWLQLNNQDASQFWVAGFSFGSWIALHLLMRRPEINGFVAVSPPTSKLDFSFLSPCPAPGLVVQGDQDSIVDAMSVQEFINKLGKQKNSDVNFKLIEGADHFYRDKLTELNEAMSDYLKDRIFNTRPRKVKPDRRRRQNQTL